MPSRLERADQPLLQLVHVEVGRVDHQIGGAAEAAETPALELDRLDAARRPRRPADAGVGSRRTGGPARPSTRRGTATVTLVAGGAHRTDLGAAPRRVGGRRRAPAGRCRCSASPPVRRSSPISDVGRLSTTNHPRSSSTSATPDRPAPESPVIRTIVRHRLERLRDGRRRRRRRYSRRGMVAASAYSGASARNPAGGAGSTIRSSTSPASLRALT